MLKQVLNDINKQLNSVNIMNYKINESKLQQLYDELVIHSMQPEKYFSYFVSYGLLLLHLETHNKLLDDSKKEECSNIILYGDLFYSLYYEYSIKHTFSLIRNNIARVLEALEIQELHHLNSSNYLLNEWINIIKQEDLDDELFS